MTAKTLHPDIRDGTRPLFRAGRSFQSLPTNARSVLSDNTRAWMSDFPRHNVSGKSYVREPAVFLPVLFPCATLRNNVLPRPASSSGMNYIRSNGKDGGRTGYAHKKRCARAVPYWKPLWLIRIPYWQTLP